MIKENDIATFKLTSGDEIIAKVVKITEYKGYEVSKPFGVMIAQQGFGLVPWILTADDAAKIHISHESVAAVVKTQDRVAAEYNRQNSSLITPPKTGIIV